MMRPVTCVGSGKPPSRRSRQNVGWLMQRSSQTSPIRNNWSAPPRASARSRRRCFGAGFGAETSGSRVNRIPDPESLAKSSNDDSNESGSALKVLLSRRVGFGIETRFHDTDRPMVEQSARHPSSWVAENLVCLCRKSSLRSDDALDAAKNLSRICRRVQDVGCAGAACACAIRRRLL